MKKATWQYFSLQEYKGRLNALRKRMEQKGVDVMLIHTPENLYYMTGYQTPGYYWYQTLVVPLEKEPVFITRLLEDSNAEHLTWVEERRPYGDSEDWVARTKEVLVDLGMGSKRIGVEKRSWFITNHDFERLKGMMRGARFVDCSMLVEEGRMIKSPQEIDYMRQAARCAERQDAYWAMHDALFERQSEWAAEQDPLPLFRRYASELGYDGEAVLACVRARETAVEVQRSLSFALALGVRSTPTLVVGDAARSGAVSWEELEALVEAELRGSRDDPSPAPAAPR